MNDNPIFIVDDDTDDHEFVRQSCEELAIKNPLLFFISAQEAINYLTTHKVVPFLILCDVNLPQMNGFKLKAKLLQDESINHKSVPFIFWSTNASNEQIKNAFDLSAHGFFIKGTSYQEIKESLAVIMTYWQKSKQPDMQ